MTSIRWFVEDEDGVRWAVRGTGWKVPPHRAAGPPPVLEFVSGERRLSIVNGAGIDPASLPEEELLLHIAMAKELDARGSAAATAPRRWVHDRPVLP